MKADAGLQVSNLYDLEGFDPYTEEKDLSSSTFLMYHPPEVVGMPYLGDRRPASGKSSRAEAPGSATQAEKMRKIRDEDTPEGDISIDLTHEEPEEPGSVPSASTSAGGVPASVSKAPSVPTSGKKTSASRKGIASSDSDTEYIPLKKAKRALVHLEDAARKYRKELGLSDQAKGKVVIPPVAEDAIKCAICQVVCSTHGRLLKHMKVHDKTSKHQCPDCKKFYSTKSRLKQHMKSHEDTTPIHCTHGCKDRKGELKVFSTQKIYNCHLKSYHPSAPVPEDCRTCEFCHKPFPTRRLMQSHQTSCSAKPGTERVPCRVDGCGMSFSRNRQMLHHMREVHGVSIM